MSGGLVALLDDVATIAKMAAASVDDIAAAAGKASAKAVGVVVDDTAVTPRYVQGFSPERELPIIKQIAIGSLRNKLLIILPVAMLLSQFLPQAMPYLLILGGGFLCFEGAEKVLEVLGIGHHESADSQEQQLGSAEHEKRMVSGAIRTDLILSAEIMAISLASVANEPFVSRLLILIVVAFVITALVYGVVGLIVKMDDIGLRLAQGSSESMARFGRGLVKAMPAVMKALAIVGTAAMLWVGGHIVLVNVAEAGWHWPLDQVHHIEEAVAHAVPAGVQGVLVWIVETLISALIGLLLGLVLAGIVMAVRAVRGSRSGAHAH
ncbi:MAG: DUF808 domain-containing protein [Actinomycetales bacterium]